MAKYTLREGTTSFIASIFIQDATAVDGAGLSGLAFGDSGIRWRSHRSTDGNADSNSIAPATMTRGTWATRGFIAKDNTNMPGVYEIGIPDAELAAGVEWVTMVLDGIADMVPVTLEIKLEPCIYHADIRLTVDTSNDEYTVTWFKDGVRLTAGITSPTIQVIKRADGADLVASTAMTEIGSTESYKYDEGTNRMTDGESALVVAGMTHGGSARSFLAVITRDV